jgi:uncharacterized protein (DUF486 family)
VIVSADTDLGTILAMRNTARPSVILFRGATPRNQIGQVKLKILQEVIALSVFVPFAVLYMKQPLKLNYLWAAMCICGAVYFVFREA